MNNAERARFPWHYTLAKG